MINVKVKLPSLVWLAVSFPAFSITVCVLLSIWLHFESANSTHCKVKNYLPSISAAVGYGPEIYVWRICIGLHSFLRFGIAFVYLNFYRDAIAVSKTPALYSFVVRLNFGCNVCENFGLVILTFVSSKENYEVHKYGFIAFIIFSLIYKIITCVLFWKVGNLRYNQKNYRSFKRKVLFLSLALLSLLMAAYFFNRHNKYCEHGIYSLFAFSEYVFVASNIAFHSTAAIDFQESFLEIFNNRMLYDSVRKPSWDV